MISASPITWSPEICERHPCPQPRSTLPAGSTSCGRIAAFAPTARPTTSCMSTSSDGSNWTAPVGIPIDAVTSTVDHFIAAIAVDPATSGGSAASGVDLLFLSHCDLHECDLPAECRIHFFLRRRQHLEFADYAGWTHVVGVAAEHLIGRDGGRLLSTAYSNGQAHAVFAVAQANNGSVFSEAIFTPTNSLPQAERATVAAMRSDTAVTRRSDHPPRRFYDLDHEHPIPRRTK